MLWVLLRRVRRALRVRVRPRPAAASVRRTTRLDRRPNSSILSTSPTAAPRCTATALHTRRSAARWSVGRMTTASPPPSERPSCELTRRVSDTAGLRRLRSHLHRHRYTRAASGAVAQLVERNNRTLEARGSIPLSSTRKIPLEPVVAVAVDGLAVSWHIQGTSVGRRRVCGGVRNSSSSNRCTTRSASSDHLRHLRRRKALGFVEDRGVRGRPVDHDRDVDRALARRRVPVDPTTTASPFRRPRVQPRGDRPVGRPCGHRRQPGLGSRDIRRPRAVHRTEDVRELPRRRRRRS